MNINTNIYSLIEEIKSDLINFFDANKFEIDIKAQELLRDLNDKNNDDSHKQKNKILEYNEKLIKIVEEIFEENMEKINQESTKALIESLSIVNERDKIKYMIINKCCYFIRSDYLNGNKILDNPIGLIIVTDWFIDENQINYLKFLFQSYFI
jgi:hypothetical protein